MTTGWKVIWVEYDNNMSSSINLPVKAIFDEPVILCDCVDYGAKQRQAGSYDGTVVLEDELHGIFLKLWQEGLTWVLHQGHHKLQGASHNPYHGVVYLGL